MSESLEEVSDRIIRGHTNSEGQWVTSPSLVRESILSVLRNERERCAKVAEAKAAYHVLRHAEFLSGHARVAAGHSGSKAEACSEVASAIREGR